MAGGVLPVIKHLPGYGRALVDSHVELPVVDAARVDLEAVDFAPFRTLNDMPLAMTAHVLCRAIDGDAPATVSARIVGEVIRGFIGFDGLLMTDDLSMEALGGAIGERAQAALAAGCDVVLHCNGKPDEMREVAAAVRPLDAAALARVAAAEALYREPEPFDVAEALARLDALLADR